MSPDKKKIVFLLIRYFLILIAGFSEGAIFHKLFLFPTTFLSAKILSVFGKTYFLENFIFFVDTPIEIAKSCVAAAAYYLFFILVMSTPVNFLLRIKLLAFNFLVFFLINTARIVSMALLINEEVFEDVHMFFWNVLSTIIVIVVWFISIKMFKIKQIPFYTDIVFLKNLGKIKKGDNSVRGK